MLYVRVYFRSFCPGVEPEPFEMGEHLVEASGKLCLLDSMLTYLHKGLVQLLVVCLLLLVVQS